MNAMVIAVFLLLCLVTTGTCQAQCPGQMDADVLILGAGMSGLGAAETLSQNGINNFLIIDQRDKVGGRIQTMKFGGGIVELGPQWVVFDDLDISRHSFDEYVDHCNVAVRFAPFGSLGTVSYNSRGENIDQEIAPRISQYQAARAPEVVWSVLDSLPESEDLTVSQGLRIGGWNPRTQLDEHAEIVAFNLGVTFPTSQASYRFLFDPAVLDARLRAFADNPIPRPVINYPEGYSAVPRCVAEGFMAENDSRLILNTAIVEIEWGDDCVCAISRGRDRYCAPYAILTFSIVDLQNGFIKFTPALPLIKNVTMSQHKLGHFLKIYMSPSTRLFGMMTWIS